MGRSRQKKYDTLGNGITIGLALPLFFFVLFYLAKYAGMPFSEFVAYLWKMKLLIKILSLCGFANLLTFLWFYRLKMDRASKGVMASTFFYALLILVSTIIVR